MTRVFRRSEVVVHFVRMKRTWRVIKTIEARMRKNLNREGRRSQKIRSSIIAAVREARVAMVIGMYMPFVG